MGKTDPRIPPNQTYLWLKIKCMGSGSDIVVLPSPTFRSCFRRWGSPWWPLGCWTRRVTSGRSRWSTESTPWCTLLTWTGIRKSAPSQIWSKGRSISTGGAESWKWRQQNEEKQFVHHRTLFHIFKVSKYVVPTRFLDLQIFLLSVPFFILRYTYTLDALVCVSFKKLHVVWKSSPHFGRILRPNKIKKCLFRFPP